MIPTVGVEPSANLTPEQSRRLSLLVYAHTLFPASPPSVVLQIARWLMTGATS